MTTENRQINDSNGKLSVNWISKTSDWFGLAYRLFDSILLLVVLSYQNYWISYCITSYNSHNKSWYFLYFVDIVLLFFFMCGALFATRYYRKLHVLRNVLKSTIHSSKEKERNENNFDEKNNLNFKINIPQWMGSLPLVWICWLFYILVMSTKIFILHLQDIAVKLYLSSEGLKIEAEPHTIRLCLGAMTVVFLLWIEVHRNNNSNQSMECIKELTTTVVFEIFDSIDLLDLLLPESSKDVEWDSSHSERLSITILVLSTINLLLPIIGLFRLSQSRFDSHKLGLKANILHNCLRIVFVNIPYMILRITFWLAIKREISIFLLKNALFLFVSIRHIVSEVHELRKSKEETKDENSVPLRVISEQNNDNVIDE